MKHQQFDNPAAASTAAEEAAMPYTPGSTPASGSPSQSREATLMAVAGVEGVGRGQDATGNEAIVVYVRDRGVARQIPREIDGLSVVVEVTGEVRAL